jgi:hypothetical protein
MRNFHAIGRALKEKFDGASLVRFINKKHKLKRINRDMKKPTKKDLVYNFQLCLFSAKANYFFMMMMMIMIMIYLDKHYNLGFCNARSQQVDMGFHKDTILTPIKPVYFCIPYSFSLPFRDNKNIH